MGGATGSFADSTPSSEITSEQAILEAGQPSPSAGDVATNPQDIRARAFSDDSYYDLAVKGIARALSVADTPFPQLSMPDTSYVDRGYDNVVKQFDVSNAAESEALTRFKQASNEEVRARGEQSNAQVAGNIADQQRAQTIAAIAQHFAEAVGIDSNSDMIAKKAVLLEQMEAQAFDRRTAIEQKQSVSIFDSPLEWIGNQITLPGEIAAYNTFAGKTRGLRDDINNAISSASNAEAFAAKTVPTITTMQMEAKNRFDLSQGLILQKQTEERLAEKDYDFASKQFTQRMALQEESSRMASLDVQRAHLEWSAKVDALKNTESEADRLLKISEIGFNLTDRFKLGVMLETYDRVTGKAPGTTSIASFTRLPKQSQEDIIGIAAGNPGTTTADVYRTFARTSLGANADPRMIQFMQTMAQKELEATQQPEYKTATGREAQDNFVKSYQNQQINMLRLNPEKDQKNNPFYQLPVGDILRADPEFAASVIGKALEPLSKGPTPPTTDQIIATLQANANGDPALAAAMISQYYAKNISVRDRVGNFGMMGLKSDNTYMYHYHSKMAFGVIGTADLTKPTQVLNMLNQRALEKALIESPERGFVAP